MPHNKKEMTDIINWTTHTHFKMPRVSTCIVQITLLMLILAFQANILLDNDSKVIYDIAIAVLVVILFLLNNNEFNKIIIKFIIFFSIFSCVGILSNDLLRWCYMPFPFFFGFLLRTKYNQRVKVLLYFLVLANFVIIICQISGINQIFYSYQNYWRYDDIVNLMTNGVDLDIVSGIQKRPPGIFPSPIYQSAFQIFLATYFFLNKENVNKQFSLLLALFFVSTGSNTSQLLVIIILIFGTNRHSCRRFLYCFLLGLFLYYFLLPPYFFKENYDLFSIIRAFQGRIIVHQTYGTTHGFFSKAPFLLLALTTPLISYFYFNRKFNLGLRNLILISSLTFGLLMLHDLVKAAWFWFYIGYLYGYICSSRLDYLRREQVWWHQKHFFGKSPCRCAVRQVQVPNSNQHI